VEHEQFPGENIVVDILFAALLFRNVSVLLYSDNRERCDQARATLGFCLDVWHKAYDLTLPSEFSFRLPLTTKADTAERSASPLEDEVVSLFEELRSRLLHYLLCLGLPVHDGEEIVQESFLLLFQHLRNGKSRQNLRGWVFRVARNLALKRRNANLISLRRLVEFDETLPEQQIHAVPDPEEWAWSRQRQKRLWAVVTALPEQDQGCLFLRCEGLRYREIAAALGISLGSVAASLARSLAKLDRADGGST
jgi:RNA polymerase sigma-70 factor (ECF subfamily)